MKSVMYIEMIFSKIFEKNGSTDIGCSFESFVHLHFCILEPPWQVLTHWETYPVLLIY